MGSKYLADSERKSTGSAKCQAGKMEIDPALGAKQASFYWRRVEMERSLPLDEK